MTTETPKIWSLYKITNKINHKVYIGQTVNISKRWHDHRKAVLKNKPTQIVHHAMIKYGLENFEFEVIASCRNQEDANETETLLVDQYNSFVVNESGYNATHGGMNAPKSEEFKQMMRDWHASLSPEEKAKRSEMHSQAMINQIENKGHPAIGHVLTDEQKAKLSASLKARDKEVVFNEEVRKKMSDAHIGKIISEEQREKMATSIQEWWNKRNAERFATGEIYCHAPGCEISGKAKYKIINGIRYCNKHGLRMLRYNRLDTLDS